MAAVCSDFVCSCHWSFLVFEFSRKSQGTSPKPETCLPDLLLPSVARPSPPGGLAIRPSNCRVLALRAADGGVRRRGGTGARTRGAAPAAAAPTGHRTSPPGRAIDIIIFVCRFRRVTVRIGAATPRRPRPYPAAYPLSVHGVHGVYLVGCGPGSLAQHSHGLCASLDEPRCGERKMHAVAAEMVSE